MATTDTTPRIDELEAALTASERGSRARDDRDARMGRLDDQITRLEAVSVRLERRMLSLNTDDDGDDATGSIVAEERVAIRERIDRIEAKVVLLRDQRSRIATSSARRPPRGAEAELRAALFDRAGALRALGDENAAGRIRRRLAALVRSRRDRLATIERRVRDAAGYLVGASDKMDALLVLLETSDSTLEGALGTERGEVAAIIDMGRDALQEGRRLLVELAWRWPELEPMASRADWSRLTFHEVRAILLPANDSAHAPNAEQVAEARRTCRGLALWCRELAEAVAAAPPPVRAPY